MDRQTYRKQFVNQEKLLNPHRKIGRIYAKRIMQPRGYLMLQSIRAEIAPKLAALNLLDTDDGFTNSRFSSYQSKGTAGKVQKSAGRGNLPEIYSIGRQTEPDLANANSRTFETPEHEMVPDNAKN